VLRIGSADGRTIDVRDAAPDELHSRIGMVTQEVQLFRATVRENLTLFDPSIPDQRILEALDRLGLSAWLARLPHIESAATNQLDAELAPGGTVWGGKTSRERRSAMLTPCLMFSGSCSQPCKPRRAHARNWCSRTSSYAINSPCSPGRLEADGVLGFAPGTSWRLFWRWKSRSRGGRPHLTPEIRALIATMSRDNRLR
jgi:hypothetical protein